MKKITFLLAIVFCCIGSVTAQDYPEKPVSWVNDFAGVIPSQYRYKLDSLIEEVEAKTSAEIFIVTEKSISPLDEKEYARQLFDAWKPGKKNLDNGILLLLAVQERRWRIETGYGMEGILPDSLCGEIGRKYMVPYFKNGEYAEGLYNATAAIAGIIAKNASIEISSISGTKFEKIRADSKPAPVFIYFFGFLFFLIWNLPWPIYIGLPFTLLFAAAFFQISPLAGLAVIAGYAGSMLIRYSYWSKLPPNERRSFFGPISYGGTFTSSGGGFSGGGFSGGGFGGGGGGSGGGGGAGGGF